MVSRGMLTARTIIGFSHMALALIVDALRNELFVVAVAATSTIPHCMSVCTLASE